MEANCDTNNFTMSGVKRNYDENSLLEPLRKYPRLNCDEKFAEQTSIDYVLDKHKIDLEETGILYGRVESFLKDMNLIWSNAETDEKLEIIISNELNRVLQHYSFRLYYRHNLESYCKLIAGILNKIHSVKTLILFIRNDFVFHKTFIIEKYFCKEFLELIFPVLITILFKNKSQELHLEICQRFKKVILDKKLGEFQNYLETVLKLTENQTAEKFEIQKAVLKTLGNIYNSDPECYLMCKVVLESIMNTFKDFKWIYAFSVVLLEVFGFDLSRDYSVTKISKFSSSEIILSKSLTHLSEILKILKDSNFDLNCSVVINFSQFMENIVNSILHLTSTPNKNCYDILEYAIDIHPLLVEKCLNNLLTYSMFADNSHCEENYNRFMMKLFETYEKLHRIHKLISKMLHVLNSIDENKNFEEYYTFRGNCDLQKKVEKNFNADRVLPDEVLHYFAKCTTKMPSKQYMNLFKTFIFHLNSTVVSFTESNDDTHNSFIELLCKFMSWLLRIHKMDENSTTPTIMKNFNQSMAEVKSILNKLGGALLEREHDQLLVRAFLKLSYDWSDRYMKFHHYNSGLLEEQEIFYDINHPNYIFSFLTNEQWTLLSQRIMNFGEFDCKHLQLKITLKKLMAMELFGNEMDESTQREAIHQISLNVENSCEYIVSEKFINKHLTHKLDSDVIMLICDHILSLIGDKPDILKLIDDSVILCNTMGLVLLKKIAKILSKGKSYSLLKKLLSTVNEENLNSESDENYFRRLREVYDENLWINCEIINKELEDKIQIYSLHLMKLPIIYLSPKVSSLIIIGLFSMHKYFWGRESEFKNILENWIKDLIQEVRIDLMQLFNPDSLVRNLTTNFNERRELVIALSEKCYKTEESFRVLATGVDYLLKHTENPQYALLFLKCLRKVKKSKSCAEFKLFCSELKDQIIKVNYELVINKEANLSLIQSYVCCLKHWIVLDGKHQEQEKLVEKLEDYLSIIFKAESDVLPEGSTELFCTVLSNKHIFKTSPELPLKIWAHCKMRKVVSCETQDFSQLFHSIFEHIPNNKFEVASSDLMNMTVEAITAKNFPQLFKHLNTCTFILNSSLNTYKFEMYQKILEKLLIELFDLKENIPFDQDVFKEIIQFEVAVINRELLILSPGIMSMLLISPYTLLKKGSDFYQKFNTCINYLECLLKHRSPMIMDRISAYLKNFRCLLWALCKKCGEVESNNSRLHIDDLADCAHQLEKLIRHLVTFKKDMARIACYLIADILHQYETYTLFPSVKVHLNNCMYSLISLCDKHSVSYLLRILSSASTELFKKVYDDYKKFHRFTGKV